MGECVKLREMATEERQTLARLAHSRTAPAGRVKRAQVVLAAVQGTSVEENHLRPQYGPSVAAPL